MKRPTAALVPYLMILPALITLLFLFVYPILWNGYLSLHAVDFQTYNREWPFVGLENYWRMLSERIFPFRFYQTLLVSLEFVGGSVVGQFIIGLGLALALHAITRGRQLFRALIVIPWVLSELVVAYIWLFLYQPTGIVNDALAVLGLPAVNWLGTQAGSIWALVLTNVWFGVPFTMLMMGSALTTIDPMVNEAARVDGARGIQIFRFITWPLILPFVALNMILITMWTVNLFALPLAMTKGGPLYSTTTTSLYMYRHAFEFGNFSIGSTLGVMLFLFNIVAAAAYLRALRSK